MNKIHYERLRKAQPLEQEKTLKTLPESETPKAIPKPDLKRK
jgi:hypothetical protein